MPGSKTRRHRGLKIALGTLLLLTLLLIGARLALTPVVAHITRQQLNARPNMSGDFFGLSLSVLTLGYHLDGLELHMRPPGGPPISAKVESIDAHLLWYELLRFHIAAEARADNIKALAIIETPEEAKEMMRQLQHTATQHGLGAKLEALPPFRVSRVELRNLDITIADQTEQGSAASPPRSGCMASRPRSKTWPTGLRSSGAGLRPSH